MLHRRRFLAGMFSALAAPAIVRVESLMPVRALAIPSTFSFEEMAAITRKAFVPRLMVQIYDQSPILRLLADIAQDGDLEQSSTVGSFTS